MAYDTATHNDAGLLREYLNARYASFAVWGGSVSTANRVYRMVRRLAKLAGISTDAVWADMRAAYDAEGQY